MNIELKPCELEYIKNVAKAIDMDEDTFKKIYINNINLMRVDKSADAFETIKPSEKKATLR